MEAVSKQIKDIIGGISGIAIAIIGLAVIARALFGDSALEHFDVIANIKGLINAFIGPEAGLAGLITLIVLMTVIGKKK